MEFTFPPLLYQPNILQKGACRHTAYTITAVKTVAATFGPSSGSPVPPTIEGWFDLKSAPMTERITMAKTEMTMLERGLVS